MIGQYTADPDRYRDGSHIGAQCIPDDHPNVICYGPLPPHRLIAEAQRVTMVKLVCGGSRSAQVASSNVPCVARAHSS
jgi:hypothetical protein